MCHERQCAVSHCVDAAMDAMQPSGAQPPIDLPLGDPGGKELGTGNHPVLNFRQRRDYRIGAIRLL